METLLWILLGLIVFIFWRISGRFYALAFHCQYRAYINIIHLKILKRIGDKKLLEEFKKVLVVNDRILDRTINFMNNLNIISGKSTTTAWTLRKYKKIKAMNIKTLKLLEIEIQKK